jgi:hypothetical protein
MVRLVSSTSAERHKCSIARFSTFLDVSLTRQHNSNVPHDQKCNHREKANRHSQQ